MKFNTIKYSFIDSLKSLKRNAGISTAAAGTVVATLFILGAFLLLILNVNQGILAVESNVEVKVFLKDSITITQQKALEDKAKSIDGVVQVTYEAKTEAMNNFKQQLGEENKSLVDGLDKNNPMPNSFIIKVNKPEIITDLVKNIKDMNGIESIKDGREIVDKLISITHTIKWIGSILFVLLICVSMFLIGNTIKLAVYSRRREIGIMKYIGATDWFIRWPFIMEGVLIGIFGAIIANLCLYYVYKLAYIKVSSGIMLMQLVSPQYVTTNILELFIISGIIIGSIGSIMSIRKFLHV